MTSCEETETVETAQQKKNNPLPATRLLRLGLQRLELGNGGATDLPRPNVTEKHGDERKGLGKGAPCVGSRQKSSMKADTCQQEPAGL